MARQPENIPPAEIGDKAALDAEVERRKAKDGGARATLTARRDFVHIGEVIKPALEEMLRRHNLRPMTDAEIAERNEEVARQQLVEMENERQARKQRQWEELCEPLFREPFDMTKVKPTVKPEEVQRVLSWHYGAKGLYVVGDSGLSKSRAVYAMLKRHIDAGRKVVARDGVGFGIECSAAFADAGRTEKWLQGLIRPDILFIDDVAKRYTTTIWQGLFAIIDRRGAAQKPTIMTANCTGDQLEAVIGDKTMSDPLRRRIREYCEVIKFSA